jgi:cytidine deaminase
MMGIDDQKLNEMFVAAWTVRSRAVIFGKTKVGCAIYADDENIYSACNVEHRFRSHDIHAEVNAITTMISFGGKQVLAIAIVAERDRFTPCGACMDWIMQFGGGDCIVAFQASPLGAHQSYRASELMPHYPH